MTDTDGYQPMLQMLGDKNTRLIDYLMQLQSLKGVVQICSSCKSIRTKDGDWKPIEELLISHPEADFSHGMCPVCMKKHYPDYQE